jgi:hypothetical protein
MRRPSLVVVVVSLALPSSPLAQTLAQPPVDPSAAVRTVTLPLAEYDRLLDQADLSRPVRAAAAAATTAAIDARAEPGAVRGTLTLRGVALGAAPERLALLEGAAVSEARAGGRDLPLSLDDTRVEARLGATGPFEVAVAWHTDVRTAAGRSSFVLPAVAAAAVRATLVLPVDAGDVRLAAGVVTGRRHDGTALVVEATLPAGTRVEASWTTRESAPAPSTAPARVVSEVGTVLTLGETDVRLAALVSVEVSRGVLPGCRLTLPSGYRLVRVTGPTVDRVDPGEDEATITFTSSAPATHRLLVELDRPHDGRSVDVDAARVMVRDAGRERGDVAVGGAGTLALTPGPTDRLRPIDARDLSPITRALARGPILAAYRYQRAAGEPASRLALSATRFARATTAAALAETSTATTFLTLDGRALTEVRLRVANARQAFVKVALPPDARIVSAALDGVPVRPVSGADGLRLPLVAAGAARAGRDLTFVFLHEGQPFLRKGHRGLALPRVDLPVGVARWDLFVPDALRVQRVSGTAVEAARYDSPDDVAWRFAGRMSPQDKPREPHVRVSAVAGGVRGQVRGRVVDQGGHILPGVSIDLGIGVTRRSAISDERGEFAFSEVPPGTVTLGAQLAGFTPAQASIRFDGQATRVEFTLAVGMIMETITVSGAAPEDEDPDRPQPAPAHVVELQQRVAGLLPLPVEVPRSGRAYAFLMPLVVDEAPTLTLRYRRR